MPFGESSVIRSNYSPLWPNNNLNIPIQNLLPTHPNMLACDQSSSQASLMSQFQSMQLRPPTLPGGMPLGGYFDPMRMLFIPPTNLAPFNPPMEHLMPQNVHSNIMLEQQMDPRIVEMNPHYTIYHNPNSASHTFQELSHSTTSQRDQDIEPVVMSEQQVLANANLELANRLSANKTIMSDDTQLLGSPPTNRDESFSSSVNDFPPLK